MANCWLANSIVTIILTVVKTMANCWFANSIVEINLLNDDEHRSTAYFVLIRAMKSTQGVRFVDLQPQDQTGESPARCFIASDITLKIQ